MRKPAPITITRYDRPDTHRIAWTAEPKPSVFTGNVRPEDKERARHEIESAIRKDGCDPAACEIIWRPVDIGWGWVARVKETA